MGGGGDDGYSERQAEQDRKKQAARNALNVNFGLAPTESTVRHEDYTKWTEDPNPGDSGGYGSNTFDQAGYDAALAAEAAMGADAVKNKAALNALYSGVRDDAFTAGKTRIDDKQQQAARDLKFELFARGLNGGSVNFDQTALLGRTYNQGLVDLGAKADATATGLRANDETTRVGLLQSIDNGMDQGSAISSALNQRKNNSSSAASEAIGTNLGDLFSTAGLLYEQGRRARGEQSAAQQFAAQQNYMGRAGKGAARGTSTWAG